ncbi:DEAD-box ATP-dependent RNA helicase 56 isoform X2 [Prunus yedoensis var. nudiflora]|uniref:DEAD-box ATP-dependent RNA helicase 56 isoform X2 n=1 Tax=Prunus yedoensis var. nudiflora TaxID=2094558 RepID=A0A314U5W3_PRUYE|nr:DEAD-box ATP-dependent RNA helicase 56 isoform X2 [Prunus yedoensis var. nudiflora]
MRYLLIGGRFVLKDSKLQPLTLIQPTHTFVQNMGETRDDVYEEELVDYEEEEEKAPDSAAKVNGEAPKK